LIRFVAIISLLVAVPVVGQEASQVSEILATVGKSQISRGQVLRLLHESRQGLEASEEDQSQQPSQFNELQWKAGLQQCIDREVVLQFLESGEFKTGPSETKLQLESFKARLKENEQTLEQWLESAGITDAEFRREIQWRNSWRKFAEKQLTEKSLRQAFASNHEHYDGTRRHVAQILWTGNDPKTVALAKKVREFVVDGTMTWKSAVAQNSKAASAENHGDLSWIGFDGPMPRKFTDVAFELKKGELSQPFVTQFGTHVVWCMDVKPGEKKFEGVAERLRIDETKSLFQGFTAKHRDSANVKLLRESLAKPTGGTKIGGQNDEKAK